MVIFGNILDKFGLQLSGHTGPGLYLSLLIL